jgi:hypothetical protein
MKFPQCCQYIGKIAVIVLGYSIITPSIGAQGNGKRSALLPKDERIGSSDISLAQPAATDRLVTAPAASRSTAIAASDSPNVRETKVKENTPFPRLESTPRAAGPRPWYAVELGDRWSTHRTVKQHRLPVDCPAPGYQRRWSARRCG